MVLVELDLVLVTLGFDRDAILAIWLAVVIRSK